jgi:hypothetical protein
MVVVAAIVMLVGILRFSDVAVVLVHEDQMALSGGKGIPAFVDFFISHSKSDWRRSSHFRHRGGPVPHCTAASSPIALLHHLLHCYVTYCTAASPLPGGVVPAHSTSWS